jgi:hypothetical protein
MFLLSNWVSKARCGARQNAARLITGQTPSVDGGYHIID